MTPTDDARRLVPLSALQLGQQATVHAVRFGVEEADVMSEAQVGRRLLEFGFLPGAQVEVIARMWPDGDPLAVRVGGSTFALRRREAAAIQVVVS
jgi:ferrous iron transport protein A